MLGSRDWIDEKGDWDWVGLERDRRGYKVDFRITNGFRLGIF